MGALLRGRSELRLKEGPRDACLLDLWIRCSSTSADRMRSVRSPQEVNSSLESPLPEPSSEAEEEEEEDGCPEEEGGCPVEVTGRGVIRGVSAEVEAVGAADCRRGAEAAAGGRWPGGWPFLRVGSDQSGSSSDSRVGSSSCRSASVMSRM